MFINGKMAGFKFYSDPNSEIANFRANLEEYFSTHDHNSSKISRLDWT
jgi:hypothetical protein